MSFAAHYTTDDAADAVALGKSKNETADFDDIKTGKSGEAPINDVYAGVNWSDFNAINPETNLKGQHLDGSGFFVGVTSGDQAAYNPDGSAPEIFRENGTFNLDSVEVTAAVDKKLEVYVNTYDDKGKQIDHIKIEITDSKPTLEKLNLQNVSEVIFFPNTDKETPDHKWDNTGVSGPYMIFDDFKFSNFKSSAAPSAASNHASFADLAGHAHVGFVSAGHEMHPTLSIA